MRRTKNVFTAAVRRRDGKNYNFSLSSTNRVLCHLCAQTRHFSTPRGHNTSTSLESPAGDHTENDGPPPIDSGLLESVRSTAREFVTREITGRHQLDTWERERTPFPLQLYRKAGEAGLLRVGYGEPWGFGTDAHRDPRYFLSVQEEIARAGSGGLSAGLFSSAIAVPPILATGSEELIERVVPQVQNLFPRRFFAFVFHRHFNSL